MLLLQKPCKFLSFCLIFSYILDVRTLLSLKKSPIEKRHFLERAKKGSNFFSAVRAPLTPLCVTASGNILTSGNLDFRVFKLQLKVVN